MNRQILALLLAVAGLLFPRTLPAQVHVQSPLPFGILQVSDDRTTASLRILAEVDAGYSDFVIRLSDRSPEDTYDILLDWTPVAIADGRVDTTILLPATKYEYTVEWHARAGLGVGGTVAGLRAGHIFGIAGQSNAQGFNWDMRDTALGDIRMLTDTFAWQPAVEPTGGVAGGPWIVMANELWKELGDSLAIGIVNTAVSGTSLTLTEQNARWFRDPQHQYDSIYRHALRRFISAGSKLEAFLWIQGEADGSQLRVPNVYCSAFSNLLDGFRTDLHQPTLRSFHLQIAGDSYPSAKPEYMSVVREAQRILSSSMLVGTAVGRSIRADGLHYTVPTYTAIGKMFADAVLSELYQKPGSSFPPLTPDSVAYIDSTSADHPSYFVRLKWHRNRALALSMLSDRQGFELTRDGTVRYDTSQVWSRIDPSDSSSTLIGLKQDVIDPGKNWNLSYIRTVGSDHAPVATIKRDRSTGTHDTLFALSFLDLPVRNLSSSPISSVRDIIELQVYPNPSTGAFDIQIKSLNQQLVTIEVADIDGRLLRSITRDVSPGWTDVPISVGDLPSEAYLLTASGSSSALMRKIVFLR